MGIAQRSPDDTEAADFPSAELDAPREAWELLPSPCSPSPRSSRRVAGESSPSGVQGFREADLGGELVVDGYGIGGLGAYRIAFDDGTTALAVCVQADIGHSLSAVYVADPSVAVPAELGLPRLGLPGRPPGDRCGGGSGQPPGVALHGSPAAHGWRSVAGRRRRGPGARRGPPARRRGGGGAAARGGDGAARALVVRRRGGWRFHGVGPDRRPRRADRRRPGDVRGRRRMVHAPSSPGRTGGVGRGPGGRDHRLGARSRARRCGRPARRRLAGAWRWPDPRPRWSPPWSVPPTTTTTTTTTTRPPRRTSTTTDDDHDDRRPRPRRPHRRPRPRRPCRRPRRRCRTTTTTCRQPRRRCRTRPRRRRRPPPTADDPGDDDHGAATSDAAADGVGKPWHHPNRRRHVRRRRLCRAVVRQAAPSRRRTSSSVVAVKSRYHCPTALKRGRLERAHQLVGETAPARRTCPAARPGRPRRLAPAQPCAPPGRRHASWRPSPDRRRRGRRSVRRAPASGDRRGSAAPARPARRAPPACAGRRPRGAAPSCQMTSSLRTTSRPDATAPIASSTWCGAPILRTVITSRCPPRRSAIGAATGTPPRGSPSTTGSAPWSPSASSSASTRPASARSR